MAKAAKKKNNPDLSGEVTSLDKRGHEVRKYQDDNGNWFVERNNNGAIHPESCTDETAATTLFNEYCEQD